MTDYNRNYRFIRECYDKVYKFIYVWFEETEGDYELSMEDLHELPDHNLCGLVRVHSDSDDLTGLVFRFTETNDYFNGPTYEVFQSYV